MRTKMVFVGLFILIVGNHMKGQIAVEFARENGQAALIPVLQKGSSEGLQDFESGFYVTERFSANPGDYKNPEWLEATLNEMFLFAKGAQLEVLYLIPEEDEQVLVLCRRDGQVGYIRVISLLEEPS